MRWLYIAVIAVFALAVAMFALQNLGSVTIAFLGFSAHAPVAVLAVVIYLFGMATGGSLMALLKRSFAAARGHTDRCPPV